MPSSTGDPPAPEDPRDLVAQLYAEHAGRVRRTLAWLGVPALRLDDAVQHVFLTAHAHLSRGEGPIVAPAAWLSSIARKSAPRFRRPDPAAVMEDEAWEIAAPLASPEERAAARDLLYKLFEGIDPDRLSVLVAVKLEGLSWEEAARAHGISVRGAKKRAAEAMEDLRRALRRREARTGRWGALLAPVSLDALFDAERAECDVEGAEHGAERAEHGAERAECGAERAECGAERAEYGAERAESRWRRPARLLGRVLVPAAAALAGLVLGLLLLPHRAARAVARSAWIVALPPASTAARSKDGAPAPSATARSMDGAPAPSAATASAGAATLSPVAPAPAAAAARAEDPAPLAPRAASASALQDEQRLLDQARAALATGDLTAAAGALSDHARRFPRGHYARRRAVMLDRICDSPAASAARPPACSKTPDRPL